MKVSRWRRRRKLTLRKWILPQPANSEMTIVRSKISLMRRFNIETKSGRKMPLYPN